MAFLGGVPEHRRPPIITSRLRRRCREIEVDAIELIPFSAITDADVRRAGEPDRETLRRRAAHAGSIGEDTLVYRIEFRSLSTAPTSPS